MTLSGSSFALSDLLSVTVDENGTIIVKTEEAKDNKFERTMPHAGKNGLAGATMMWESLKNKSQGDALMDVFSKPNSDYAKLGASVATIAPALMQDMHRQLASVRNRTTSMNAEQPADASAARSVWHAWINGEGGYHKVDADGYLPGYTLNSWGGAVGVALDVGQQTTMGLAVSAMYGDLKADAADTATGHLDTTYLSAFMRAGSGPWTHTFDMDRTVSYGSGSYRTNGSTDGYAFGALYEVGYTTQLNKEGTVGLQPVFNVELRHAQVKGYTESGSDAALRTDDMQQDVVTFGAGARMQCVLGENAFNRSSVLEARCLLKVDAGDRSGKVNNGIVGSGTMAEVESAKVGAFSIEVGVGLTIPLSGNSGSIFMDASVETRSGWTSANASAGYRINF